MISMNCFGQSWNRALSRNESGLIKIKFSEMLALDSISLPTVSTELWGKGVRCRAATIRIGSQNFLSSTKTIDSPMLFNPGGAITDTMIISPVFTEPATNSMDGLFKVEAVRARIRQIEDEITALSNEVLEFQNENRCFSCHTAFPIAMVLNEADKKGFKIPQQAVEKIGASIGAMQKVDGTFHFSNQPDYGTISPTLCAGAVLALLARFAPEMLTNINKIAVLFPKWYDEKGDLKSDFFFKPLFLGQTSSALFEALVFSSLYYFEPSVTGKAPNEMHRKRLIHLNQNCRIDKDLSVIHSLLILSALPYIGQFSNEQSNLIANSIKSFVENEPEASRADISTLAQLFFSRMKNREGLKAISALKIPAKTLSERIWNSLAKILRNNPDQPKN